MSENTPAEAPKREVQTIYVAEAEDGIRLDRWFRRRWPHLSNIQVQKMARSGQIRVDGARIKPEGRLTAGAAVRVPPIPDDTSRQAGDVHTLSAQDIKFAKSLVLYEDDMVIAINKPHGLAVQGGTKTSRHVDRLLSAWGEGMDRPRLVHRLDRDTSGVLLLGKHEQRLHLRERHVQLAEYAEHLRRGGAVDVLGQPVEGFSQLLRICNSCLHARK